MSEPSLSMTADDDLPRTIRREREAREREARERASAVVATGPTALERNDGFALPAPAATVTDFDVPFAKLMMFFVKAVFASVPALLLLTIMLWLFGHGLQAAFPQLLKMKILIYMPQ